MAKKRESYLVSRISKKDFGVVKRIGYNSTRDEQRDTRMATEEIVLRQFLDLPDRIYRMSKELLTGKFIMGSKGVAEIKNH